MQQTLFEITGTTPQTFIDNIINFFVQRGWEKTITTEGSTYPWYHLKYNNMAIVLQNDEANRSLYLQFYYSKTYPDLFKIIGYAIDSYKINTLYTMRIRYIENEFFCYVELYHPQADSTFKNYRDSLFSLKVKEPITNNLVEYFGRRMIVDNINISEDLTFKIACKLDENYPDKYDFANYLKPIATADSQMLMTKHGVPLVDVNFGINKGEVLGTRMLMGAIRNQIYKIEEEYWFCFYPNYVALIEEKELITESEETN